jgi:NAD(P)-dependent dehydrogenase (short-subunit alcohol dehydrogenase family)
LMFQYHGHKITNYHRHAALPCRVHAQHDIAACPLVHGVSLADISSATIAADYSASKAAVINLMQTSAFQLSGTNVRCNAVCPGLIETGMTSVVYESARKRGTVGKIGQINPLKRGGNADEVARVALFLASDEYVP